MPRTLRDRAKIPKPKRLIDEVDNSPRKRRAAQGPSTVTAAPQPAEEPSSHPEDRAAATPTHEAHADPATPAPPAPEPPSPETAPPDSPPPDTSPGIASAGATSSKTLLDLPAELRLMVYEECGYPVRLRPIPGSDGLDEEKPAYFRFHGGHALEGVNRQIRGEVREEERKLNLTGSGMDIVIHEDESMYQAEHLIRLILCAFEGEERCFEAGEEVGSKTWRDLAITRPIIEYLDRGSPKYDWITVPGNWIPDDDFVVLSDEERTVLEDWLELQLAIERSREPTAQRINFRILHDVNYRKAGSDFTRWTNINWTIITSWMQSWCDDLDPEQKIKMVSAFGPAVPDAEMAQVRNIVTTSYLTNQSRAPPNQLDFDKTRPEEQAVLDQGVIITNRINDANDAVNQA